MFADTKRVESDLVGVLDLLDQLPQPVGRIHRTAVLVEGGGEAVDSNLHGGHQILTRAMRARQPEPTDAARESRVHRERRRAARFRRAEDVEVCEVGGELFLVAHQISARRGPDCFGSERKALD